MIRCVASKKPKGFEEKVEKPGKRWLQANRANPAKRPPSYWRAYQPQLAAAFKDRCAYGAMYEPSGTVDHFVSINEDRGQAYTWPNYRYCSHWLNASKQSLRSTDLLDPFQVKDGWFEISLPSLQLLVSDAIPKKYRKRAENMLERLHLRHDERVLKQRRAWLKKYEEKQLSLDGLFAVAPLIALAIVKQRSAKKSEPRKRAPARSAAAAGNKRRRRAR